jgi:predicted glycosyltransferase
MRFELLPLISAIEAAQPRPKLLSSVRDILQENRKAGRDAETVGLVQAHFDTVLVHGDPTFVRLEDTFPLTSQIADKIAYTGIVAPPPPADASETFDIIASAGGGAVGMDLLRAAAGAAKMLPGDLRWLLISGPNLPERQFCRAFRDDTVKRHACPVSQGFPIAAWQRTRLHLAGGLQHRRRFAANRLPPCSHSICSRWRDGADGQSRASCKAWSR